MRDGVGTGMKCRCVGAVERRVEGVVVAAQSHGIQGGYLSMKMFTKFTETSARSWPKPN